MIKFTLDYKGNIYADIEYAEVEVADDASMDTVLEAFGKFLILAGYAPETVRGRLEID